MDTRRWTITWVIAISKVAYSSESVATPVIQQTKVFHSISIEFNAVAWMPPVDGSCSFVHLRLVLHPSARELIALKVGRWGVGSWRLTILGELLSQQTDVCSDI